MSPEPVVYTIVHRPGEDVAVRYEGMGVQVISDMLSAQGLTATVVTQAEHDAFEKTKVDKAGAKS